ncbi:TPA: radical SAM protein [bacterium]|nr:radical SAM protein [bacterium]
MEHQTIKLLSESSKRSNLCNTSYPLRKEHWSEYKVEGFDLFQDEDELCVYIHIPFCDHLCSFCEYTKYLNRKDDKHKTYINILERDIKDFFNNRDFKLYGFDIGGGTPTSLNITEFKRLMEIAKDINSSNNKALDFEPSIEGTFSTLSEEKIKLIVGAGFKRVSLGVQTTNTHLLLENNRKIVNLNKMKETFKLLKVNGIEKINLDFMYGLKNQTKLDIINSLKIIRELNPEQVTLYEMRYNMVNDTAKQDREALYEDYTEIYEYLTSIGYNARFSQNTFSKDNKDLGLSSYLRYRMIDNMSYKGFGIAAQSKSKLGVSYNVGKSSSTFNESISRNTFYEEDIYVLSKEELLAKYIAISMYYGEFDLGIMEGILKEDPRSYFKDEFEYLISNNYIAINDNKVIITRPGFKYYSTVGAMFYSNKTKRFLIESEVKSLNQ